MKPSFDDLFAKNVRSAFDSYQEEADMAVFAQIQSKLKPKSSPIFWQMKWAAILILGLICVWVVVQKLSPEKETSQNLAETTFSTMPKITIPTEEIPKKEETKNPNKDDVKKEKTSVSSIKKQKPKSKINLIPTQIKNDSTLLALAPIIVADSAKSEFDSLNTVQFFTEIRKENDSLTIASPAKQILPVAENPISPVIKQTKSNSKWEFVAASLITVSDNKVNDGFGFMAGAVKYWKLTNYMSLGTGGILNQNQFTIPKPALLYDAFVYDVLASSVQVNRPVTETQTIQTTALDIPISFMWEFPTAKKNRYFVTLGLSSLIYLNQTFKENGAVYQGEVVTNNSKSELVITKVDFTKTQNETAFRHVDLAKMMNFSIGYEFGKNTVVEWFVKYPFGDLTSKELNYSLTGIGLKYSFVKSKK